MKIVIEIPEYEYKLVRHGNKSYMTELVLMNAVAEGTPLPNVHGRLIDEQSIIDRFKPVEKYEYWRIGLDGLFNVLSDAPTIIEGSDSE